MSARTLIPHTQYRYVELIQKKEKSCGEEGRGSCGRERAREIVMGAGNITKSDVVVLEVLIKVSASLSLVGSLFIIISYIFVKVSLLHCSY